jgi:hypothetical protein
MLSAEATASLTVLVERYGCTRTAAMERALIAFAAAKLPRSR